MHEEAMLMYIAEASVAGQPCLVNPFNGPLVVLQWEIVWDGNTVPAHGHVCPDKASELNRQTRWWVVPESVRRCLLVDL